MAQVIEFYIPLHFRPDVRRLPQEQLGKVIAFISCREESAEIVRASAVGVFVNPCEASERGDFEFSLWLSVQNRSESKMLLGGTHYSAIEYAEYRFVHADAEQSGPSINSSEH